MHKEADLWLLTGLVSRIYMLHTLFSYKNVIDGRGSIIAKKNNRYETKVKLQ